MTALFAQSSGYYYSTDNPAFLFGGLIFGLAALGFSIYAAVDANKYDDATWQRAGQQKTLWMVLLIGVGLLGCLCCAILGFIAPAIYFLNIKKKLDEAQGGGYPGGGYPAQPGYPPGGYPPGGYPPAGGYQQPGQYPPGSGYDQPPPNQYPPPGGYPPQDQPPAG